MTNNKSPLKEPITIQTIIDEMNDMDRQYLEGIELEKFNLCLSSLKSAQYYADLPKKIEGMKKYGDAASGKITYEQAIRNQTIDYIINQITKGK